MTDAGIARAAVTGAAVGYLVALMLVATIVLVAGGGLGAALGVGAYVAIWGGPGFGGMVAAQRHADRVAAEERIAQRKVIDPAHTTLARGALAASST